MTVPLGSLGVWEELEDGKTQRVLAEEIGVVLKTMEQYRHVAEIYTKDERSSNLPWSAHMVLMAQPDRAELVKTVSTVKEARELVKGRGLAKKEGQAAETPQPGP